METSAFSPFCLEPTPPWFDSGIQEALVAQGSSLDPLNILLQLWVPRAGPALTSESLGAWGLWPLMREEGDGGSQLEDLLSPQEHPDPV